VPGDPSFTVRQAPDRDMVRGVQPVRRFAWSGNLPCVHFSIDPRHPAPAGRQGGRARGVARPVISPDFDGIRRAISLWR